MPLATAISSQRGSGRRGTQCEKRQAVPVAHGVGPYAPLGTGQRGSGEQPGCRCRTARPSRLERASQRRRPGSACRPGRRAELHVQMPADRLEARERSPAQRDQGRARLVQLPAGASAWSTSIIRNSSSVVVDVAVGRGVEQASRAPSLRAHAGELRLGQAWRRPRAGSSTRWPWRSSNGSIEPALERLAFDVESCFWKPVGSGMATGRTPHAISRRGFRGAPVEPVSALRSCPFDRSAAARAKCLTGLPAGSIIVIVTVGAGWVSQR